MSILLTSPFPTQIKIIESWDPVFTSQFSQQFPTLFSQSQENHFSPCHEDLRIFQKPTNRVSWLYLDPVPDKFHPHYILFFDGFRLADIKVQVFKWNTEYVLETHFPDETMVKQDWDPFLRSRLPPELISCILLFLA